eukprot:TRINITY_DN5916_c0_g1_i1.p1 TRINITY_DN5916_c0_g1~~TRINITY_DN5916_c0_g1_i1.p1  ORF type:complete len:384 (+),score=53.71 TRINITY_DN5916_c0_g1_i1:138-1289(+)
MEESDALLKEAAVWREEDGSQCIEAHNIALFDSNGLPCALIDENSKTAFRVFECDIYVNPADEEERSLVRIRATPLTYAIQGGGQRSGIWLQSERCWYYIRSVHESSIPLLSDSIQAVSSLCALFHAVQQASAHEAGLTSTQFVNTVRRYIPKPSDPRWLRFYCYHIKSILANVVPDPFFGAVESPLALAKTLAASSPSPSPASSSSMSSSSSLSAPSQTLPAASTSTILVTPVRPTTKPSRNTRSKPKKKDSPPHIHNAVAENTLQEENTPPTGNSADTTVRRLPALWIHDDPVLICAFCSSAYDSEHIPQWLECHRRHVLSEELAVMREHARNLLRLRSLVASSRVRGAVETQLAPPNTKTAEALLRAVNAAYNANPASIT